MKILINVTNARHVGGGLQVVNNFLRKSALSERADVEWFYAVSETLDKVYLDDDFKSRIAEDHYFVFPNQPDFRHTYCSVQKQLRALENRIDPDVIFTILAPCYNFFKRKEVIRFVNAWVIGTNKYAWCTLHGLPKVKMFLHRLLIRLLLWRTDYFITQTNTIKQGLIKTLGKRDEVIRVVSNILPEIYRTMDNTPIVEDGRCHVVSVGSGAHKNLDIIPEVLHLLQQKHGIADVRFHVTLSDKAPELGVLKAKAEALGVQESIVNHGPLSQADLALLYRKSTLCFLPSVLEVFSASTIEAMFFRLPTVATDLSFNRDAFEDSCLYYTPMNAEQAAAQIAKLHQQQELRTQLIEKMQTELLKFSDFDNYFHETVNFLVEVGNQQIKR